MPPKSKKGKKSKEELEEAQRKAELDAMPPMKLDTKGKPIFNTSGKADSNIDDPSVSYLARHEQWRMTRMLVREHWRHDRVTTTRVYSSSASTSLLDGARATLRVAVAGADHQTLAAALGIAEGAGGGGGSDSGGDGGEEEKGGLTGSFLFLALHVDLSGGGVVGEGAHSVVGNFCVKGRITGSGFTNKTNLEIALHWGDGRYKPLELKGSVSVDWSTLHLHSQRGEKMTLALLSVGEERGIEDKRSKVFEWAEALRTEENPAHLTNSGFDEAEFIAAKKRERAEKQTQSKGGNLTFPPISSSSGGGGSSSQQTALNGKIQNKNKNKNSKGTQDSDESDSDDDDDAAATATGVVRKVALPKGPMNYLQHVNGRIRTSGWAKKRDSEPSWSPASLTKNKNKTKKPSTWACAVCHPKHHLADVVLSACGGGGGGGNDGDNNVNNGDASPDSGAPVSPLSASSATEWNNGKASSSSSPPLSPSLPLSLRIPVKLLACPVCARDQLGFDDKGFDTEGYDTDGFNASNEQRPLAQRLARKAASAAAAAAATAGAGGGGGAAATGGGGGGGGGAGEGATGERASSPPVLSVNDLMSGKGKRVVVRACVPCSYVGPSTKCPMCGRHTIDAPMGARLYDLTTRMLLGTDRPSEEELKDLDDNHWRRKRHLLRNGDGDNGGDGGGSRSTSRGGADNLKPKKTGKPSYSEVRVRGMLGSSGQFRTSGQRTHLLVFGGRDSNRKVLGSAELLLPGASSWLQVSPMLVGRALSAAVPTNSSSNDQGGGSGGGSGGGGRVYAVGGVNSLGTRLSSVEFFDVHEAKWHQAPPLAKARSGCAGCVVSVPAASSTTTASNGGGGGSESSSSLLLAIGGRGAGEEGTLSSVEALVIGGGGDGGGSSSSSSSSSVIGQRWSSLTVSPLLVRRERCISAVVTKVGHEQLEPWRANCTQDEEVVVVAGGLGVGGTVLSSVEVWSPSLNQWRQGAEMPEGRYGGGCAAHKGLVYLVGGLTAKGFADPMSALVYDVRADAWLSPLPPPLSSPSIQSSSAAMLSSPPSPSFKVPLRTPVDHIPMSERREDDSYYCGRDGGALVPFEGNRIALLGGSDVHGHCFGTSDVVTPLEAWRGMPKGAVNAGLLQGAASAGLWGSSSSSSSSSKNTLTGKSRRAENKTQSLKLTMRMATAGSSSTTSLGRVSSASVSAAMARLKLDPREPRLRRSGGVGVIGGGTGKAGEAITKAAEDKADHRNGRGGRRVKSLLSSSGGGSSSVAGEAEEVEELVVRRPTSAEVDVVWDALNALPITSGLKPRDSEAHHRAARDEALRLRESAVVPATTALAAVDSSSKPVASPPRESRLDDEDDEDEDDDEGLWPGEQGGEKGGGGLVAPTTPERRVQWQSLDQHGGNNHNQGGGGGGRRRHDRSLGKDEDHQDGAFCDEDGGAFVDTENSGSGDFNGGGDEGGGHGDDGSFGDQVYLPLCLNALPAMRIRRAWHGAAALERYEPEVAKLSALAGGADWARAYRAAAAAASASEASNSGATFEEEWNPKSRKSGKFESQLGNTNYQDVSDDSEW